MKIVVLIENTAPEGSCLAAEHGLSFYVEHRGRRSCWTRAPRAASPTTLPPWGWIWGMWTWRCCPTDTMTTPAAWGASLPATTTRRCTPARLPAGPISTTSLGSPGSLGSAGMCGREPAGAV